MSLQSVVKILLKLNQNWTSWLANKHVILSSFFLSFVMNVLQNVILRETEQNCSKKNENVFPVKLFSKNCIRTWKMEKEKQIPNELLWPD